MQSVPVCIEIENLTKTYGLFKKTRALDGINLKVNQGDIFALIGPNGAGKTTLMGCMLALLKPTTGRIRIQGEAPGDLSVRRVTGFLPERPYFDAWMTAGQFLHYHHMLAERPDNLAKQEIKEVLEQVQLESDVIDRQIRKFSRGMLQRLGLAQVLIGKPQVCFLDEPVSGMDPLGVELVRKLLVHWRRENVTVILNSHHLDEVERVCNRYAFIRGGKIEAQEDLESRQTQALFVRWAADNGAVSGEQLNAIAARSEATMIEYSDSWAKFVLVRQSGSPALIKNLVESGIALEEAVLERKSLSDLFHNGTPHSVPEETSSEPVAK